MGSFLCIRAKPASGTKPTLYVTNVALNFAPGEVVQSRVEFVTTGPVDLPLENLTATRCRRTLT